MNRNRLWLVLGALAGVVLAWIALRGVLVALTVSAFVAYLFNPFVGRLSARGLPRSIGALLVVLLGGLVLAGALLAIAPRLAAEAAYLAERLPAMLTRIETDLYPRLRELSPVPLPVLDAAGLQSIVTGAKPAEVGRTAGMALASFFRGTASLLSGLIQLALIPVIGFYLLRDMPRLRAGAVELIPPGLEDRVVGLAEEVDRVISAYLRGQLTVCLIVAVLYSVGFALAGVPFALLVGTAAGVLTLIPYAGPAIGLTLALGLSLLDQGVSLQLLWATGAYAIVNGVEGSIITPNLVGDRLGLHPLVVVLGLVAGGELLGLVGMLLAVPFLAVARVAVWPAVRDLIAGVGEPRERPGRYA